MEFLTIGLLALVYFFPTIVAGNRQHKNAGAVFALNLFLGWTLVGWVLALVWSVTAQEGEQQQAAGEASQGPAKTGAAGEIERLQALREKNAITDDEFAALKAKAIEEAGR